MFRTMDLKFVTMKQATIAKKSNSARVGFIIFLTYASLCLFFYNIVAMILSLFHRKVRNTILYQLPIRILHIFRKERGTNDTFPSKIVVEKFLAFFMMFLLCRYQFGTKEAEYLINFIHSQAYLTLFNITHKTQSKLFQPGLPASSNTAYAYPLDIVLI